MCQRLPVCQRARTVSSSHEAMHRLFQEDPGVFARTARALGHSFTDPVEVSVLPTDLTEPSPLERRVDTLLRFDTAGPEGSFLLAVEAQSRRSDAKPASWAYYASYLYTKYGLPPVLLVICHDRATAAWAARHVDIGPPQWPTLTLRPLVLGPQNVPVVLDPDVARADIPLAALSAITHSDHPDIGAILKALAGRLEITGRGRRKHRHRAHRTRPGHRPGSHDLEGTHGRRPLLLPLGDRAEASRRRTCRRAH
ncbi:hypothetical protein ACQPZG_14280 [Streptomyces sp. CA-294286]|uniref:hypothetical protein n=1 Tax=Streptomyces sp. CA-294286 TaxID=3240070 RepID=UPI003D8A0C38